MQIKEERGKVMRGINKILIAVVVLLSMAVAAFAGEIEDLHKDILYPTVRIRAEGSTGSGVIFASVKNAKGLYDTYIMTNHHVVDGAISIKEEWNPLTQKMVKRETRATVDVEQFKYQHLSQATGTLLIQADIMEWNKDQDLALLRLRSDDKFEAVKLFPLGKENELKIFMKVYVCGAGTGHAPFPTRGEISSLRDEIDNQPFYMINAPIVFGNSGGGCFLADTREYIGIPSRVAVTFTSWAPNAVYHMGYIIPVSRIFKWLKNTGWESVYNVKAPSREEWIKEKRKEVKADEK